MHMSQFKILIHQVGAYFHSDFVSRVGIPVAVGLFIHCHFLLEVQLLCLSLQIELLTFEDSEWSRGRQKMECQVEKLEHFRYILLFEFNRRVNATEAARNFYALYVDSAIGEITARKWFSHFKEDCLTLLILHVQEELRGFIKIV